MTTTCDRCGEVNPADIHTCTPPAAPAQEPVAIVSGYYGGQCVILPTEPARLFNSGTAFYTTPPAAQPTDQGKSCYCPNCEALSKQLAAKRQPLTNEQIEEIFQEAAGADEGVVQRFARFIEAAHGITEKGGAA